MIKKITVITSARLNSEVHTRAVFFASAFQANGVSVSFIKSTGLPIYLSFFISIFRFFRLMISPKTVMAFNPGKGLMFALSIKKIFGGKIISDIWDVRKLFYKRNSTALSIIKKSWKITYPNENVLRLIRSFYKDAELEKFILLPTGANGFEILASEYGISKMKHSKGLPEIDIKDSYKKFILYAGDLIDLKDIDEILICFSIISDRADDVKFVLVGGGDRKSLLYLKDAIKKLDLQHKTEITGYLYPLDTALWIKKADVMVDYMGNEKISLLKERLFLPESLSLEKPIACSDGGSLSRFADYTYQRPCDNVEIVNAIVKVAIEGKDGREKEGKAYLEENLNYRNIAAQFLKEISG